MNDNNHMMTQLEPSPEQYRSIGAVIGAVGELAEASVNRLPAESRQAIHALLEADAPLKVEVCLQRSKVRIDATLDGVPLFSAMIPVPQLEEPETFH